MFVLNVKVAVIGKHADQKKLGPPDPRNVLKA